MTKKVADAKVRLTLEDKITAPLKRLQGRFQDLSHKLGVPRFSAAVKNMTASLKGVQGALSTAASRASIFTGALGLAGGGLVASLTAVTMKTMHMGDSLHHASRHLGMSVAALQLWGDAADNSGTSSALFQQSLAVLNRRSAQAFAGQKRGIMGFEALGISVKDASGKLKSNSILLEEITDKMSQMNNQAQRQHIAALLFGGDGKEMAAMLSQGMGKIKDLFADARKGKWMIGADVAEYAADLSDKLGAFKSQLGGIASFIGARFMPVLNDLIDAFSALIDENRDLIQTTVTKWAKSLKDVLKALCDPTSDLRQNISGITERIKGWFKWMEPLIGEISLFKVGLVALSAFIFGPLIASLVALSTTFITLGAAIMTTPVGWILGGIALLVGAGYLLYKNWDTVTSYLSKLWDSFVALCSDVFDNLFTFFKDFSPLYWIATKINSLIDWLFGVNLMDAGANLISGLWEGMKSAWQTMYNWLSGAIKKLTSWMPSWMKEKLGFSATIDKSSTETIKSLTEETSTRAKRITDATVVTNTPPQQRNSSTHINSVEAAKIKALNASETIMVQKPAEVDASITISNLNISGGRGSADEIQAAVNQVLERQAKQQRLAIASSFSD
ncbi:phage tail protein [Bartonella sp. CB74]|uniref:phage tail protein n=2 Tax=unclassified Bartonella TaxID=2645622 RepID=UPI002F9638EB